MLGLTWRIMTAFMLVSLIALPAFAIDAEFDPRDGLNKDETELLGLVCILLGMALLFWLVMTGRFGIAILYFLLLGLSFFLFGIFGPLFILFIPLGLNVFGFRRRRKRSPVGSAPSSRKSQAVVRRREIVIPVPLFRWRQHDMAATPRRRERDDTRDKIY